MSADQPTNKPDLTPQLSKAILGCTLLSSMGLLGLTMAVLLIVQAAMTTATTTTTQLTANAVVSSLFTVLIFITGAALFIGGVLCAISEVVARNRKQLALDLQMTSSAEQVA